MGGPPPGGPGGPPPPDPTSDLVPSDIQTYKTADGQDLKVFVFNPEGHSAADKSPALLFFHGGGLRRGTPVQGYSLSETFNPMGVVVIPVQYRLLDTDGRTLDEIISDAKSSVRWVRAHAGELGIDPDRIAISGHSAGGYLAAAAGMIDKFDTPDENLSISSKPDAMILWSASIERSERNSGGTIPEGASLEDFQPAYYLDGKEIPSVFILGSADPIVNRDGAEAFVASLADAGNVSSFHLVEGADHFFNEPAQIEAAHAIMADFLTSIGFVGD